MWQMAADGYADRVIRSVDLAEADEEIDILHERLTKEIAAEAMPTAVAAQVTLLARFYERLGDHAVNLARRMSSSSAEPTPRSALRRPARDLLLDRLEVEVVPPLGDEALCVHPDHRAPVDHDRDGAAQTSPADPLEGAAGGVAVHRGDLLAPVGERGPGHLLDRRQVGGGLVDRVAEERAGGEEGREIPLGPEGLLQPGRPVAPVHAPHPNARPAAGSGPGAGDPG